MGPFALARTPMYDSKGDMTRQWVLFFAALGSVSGAVLLTVVNGIATPDLSQGTRFLLILTADVTLALPANAPSDPRAAPLDWTLIVQQDSVGGHSLITTAYHTAYALATADSPASTESVQNFSTDSSTTRIVGAPSVDQPIP